MSCFRKCSFSTRLLDFRSIRIDIKLEVGIVLLIVDVKFQLHRVHHVVVHVVFEVIFILEVLVVAMCILLTMIHHGRLVFEYLLFSLVIVEEACVVQMDLV